ncbi:hypothetical protein E2C01_027613 [Portunus trituberculatus]|uniref:Uncharacterized protein n=1 Tax=Portunus trituberculatus TaxID=210409 RepID=A0A5B7EIB6_PORTR|nr:hypothetical protein [Portunus trituberculatus]
MKEAQLPRKSDQSPQQTTQDTRSQLGYISKHTTHQRNLPNDSRHMNSVSRAVSPDSHCTATDRQIDRQTNVTVLSHLQKAEL